MEPSTRRAPRTPLLPRRPGRRPQRPRYQRLRRQPSQVKAAIVREVGAVVVMGWIAVGALGFLLASGCWVLLQEIRRYRADRAHAPAPEPEEAALDRWNAWVVMVVAGISVVGALLAFWASADFSAASSASQQAVQEATQYQTIKSEQDGFINFGADLTQTVQEHTVQESTLYKEAAAAWSSGQASLAQQLEADARAEGAVERALISGYTCYWANLPGPGGVMQYNIAELQASEVESPCVLPGQDSSSLRTLGPSHQQALTNSAANDRSHGEAVVLAGALLILAVFCLTVSYLGPKHRRSLAVSPGVVSIAAALVVAAALGTS